MTEETIGEIEWEEGEVRFLLTEPDLIEILLMGDELEAYKQQNVELSTSLAEANQKIYTQDQEIEVQRFQKSLGFGAAATGWVAFLLTIIFAL